MTPACDVDRFSSIRFGVVLAGIFCGGLSVERSWLDSGGVEELANLGSMLNHVKRTAADVHPEGCAAVSVPVGQGPCSELIGEGSKRPAHTVSAPPDVAEHLGLRKQARWVGVAQELADRWRRIPALELAREVVVEADQGVVSEDPGRRPTQSSVVRARR